MEHETLFPLLCKTADGDKKAFAELYKITSPQLYAVALRLLKRPELADEHDHLPPQQRSLGVAPATPGCAPGAGIRLHRQWMPMVWHGA